MPGVAPGEVKESAEEKQHLLLSECTLSILVWLLPGYCRPIICWFWHRELTHHVFERPCCLTCSALQAHCCWEELLTGERQRLTVLMPSGVSLRQELLRAYCLSHCHYPAIYLRGLGLPRKMSPVGTILYCPCYCAGWWWRPGVMSPTELLLGPHGAYLGLPNDGQWAHSLVL